MARVLVTGMSGPGKSTVLEVLRRRGYYTAKSGQAPNEESYGKSSEQQEEILGYVETVEPLLRAGSTFEPGWARAR